MKKKIILVLIIAFIFVAALILLQQNLPSQKEFKTEKGNADIVRFKNPLPNQIVISPLVVEGEARGMWFFEASFPVVLVDWDGRIIAQGIATAQPIVAGESANWMTENYVPFKATLEFKKPDNIGDFSKKGALILKKDNPSGLPEHDDSLEIPVMFW